VPPANPLFEMLLGVEGKLDHALEQMSGGEPGKVVVDQFLYIQAADVPFPSAVCIHVFRIGKNSHRMLKFPAFSPPEIGMHRQAKLLEIQHDSKHRPRHETLEPLLHLHSRQLLNYAGATVDAPSSKGPWKLAPFC
jgi:hypothetical protein